MLRPLLPKPVKLFLGMLSREAGLFVQCSRLFIHEYGPTDQSGPVLPWEHTDYYRDEMGPNLLRTFVFFEQLIDPSKLIAVKMQAMRIEETFSLNRSGVLCRRINIDPGYLTESKVVLATTKDFPHRVYIGNGIFAESTLHFHKNKGYLPVDHTYPDFRLPRNLQAFNEARDKLHANLKG